MPPPSTSTKPRVESGELRRTQTMPSAIASPRLRPILFPLTLLSCPVLWRVPPGPPIMSPARQALKRSKPSLAGLSHARYPTTMMIMRSVWCGGENEPRGGRHKNEYCWMRRHVKMSKQNENKKWNHDASPPSLEKETLQSSATWRKSLSSGDFLRFFAGDNSYKSCQNQRENSHFPVISFTPPQSATFEFIWLITIKSHRSKSPSFQIHSVNVDAKEKKTKNKRKIIYLYPEKKESNINFKFLGNLVIYH